MYGKVKDLISYCKGTKKKYRIICKVKCEEYEEF
jgi:hypothetical protein